MRPRALCQTTMKMMQRIRRLNLLWLVLLAMPMALVFGCRSVSGPGVATPAIGNDLLNQQANAEASIDSENASQLQLAWQIHNPTYITHAPLVDRDCIYFADWGGIVTAADAKTGQTLWMSEAERPHEERPWHGYCGTGVLAGGRLFEASAEGRAVALDARNGKLLWQQRFTFHPDAGNRGDLLYHDGLLYIPVSDIQEPRKGAASGSIFRGSIVALAASNGRVVWEQNLISVEPQRGSELVGVLVPGGFALDPDSDLLFVTTGHIHGIGPSPLADSILALDAKNGTVCWTFHGGSPPAAATAEAVGQNYGFAAAPQLFEARIGGTMRRLICAGDKNGRFWVLDRDSGALVWSTTLGSAGLGGGIAADASIAHHRALLWSNRAFDYQDPESHPMDIAALDAANGRALWLVSNAQPAGSRSAGFLSRDVYFVGSLDGKVRAYNALDGTKIWTSPVTGPIGSSLVVAGGRLVFCTGVPPWLGGSEGGGSICAFTVPSHRPGHAVK